jgi:type II secretory pathway pseudopilin PulG
MQEAATQDAGSDGSPQLKLPSRAAFTLLDCVAALTIIGVMLAVMTPRASGFLDSLSVHGATSDAFAIFSTARGVAAANAAQATVDIDTVRTMMIVRTGQDTVLKRDLGSTHQVKLSATRSSIVFSPNGLG